jgi:hypothetical protein
MEVKRQRSKQIVLIERVAYLFVWRAKTWIPAYAGMTAYCGFTLYLCF